MVKKKQSKKNKKQQYKGVRMRSWGSWVSEIRAPSQKTRIWLGSYSTAEAAARAYDAALLCLKGPNSHFNFSDSAGIYVPPAAPLSAKSIQTLAAAAAANAPSSTPPASPSAEASSCVNAAAVAEECSSVDSWLHSAAVLFQSPKCIDQLMMLSDGGGCSFFDPLEDTDYVGDFSLWNFC